MRRLIQAPKSWHAAPKQKPTSRASRLDTPLVIIHVLGSVRSEADSSSKEPAGVMRRSLLLAVLGIRAYTKILQENH